MDKFIEYETELIGKVKIAFSVYEELLNGEFERFIIAGICKNRTIKNQEPILIDYEFINNGYKKYSPPIDFEEKCYSLIKTLYLMIGKENKSINLNPKEHFPLAYASPEEFGRIIEQLHNDNKLSIEETKILTSCGDKLYLEVKLTRLGKEEAKKSLPKMPLFGLVNQSITSGNFEIDQKINHARELFFTEPMSMDKMRSACETLIYILEPLRQDLKNYFNSRDTEAFFLIVNNFDIRHNKETTKEIEHPEQLEWLFYSLLNTVNTYTKLKLRLQKLD